MRCVRAVLGGLAALIAMVAATPLQATTVKDLTRISGQGQYILRGVGLVIGLPGTGDSGKDLVMARPLASVLANDGNALGSVKDLSNSRSVALVLVTCVIPESGAKFDDRFDVSISVVNSAANLKGGRLYLAPLRGPLTDSPVFAIAEGAVELEDPTIGTTARVRSGARMIREVNGPELGDSFELILDSSLTGYTAATEIATAINAAAQLQGPGVATVQDERTIRVSIPIWERKDRAAFVAAVLAADVNTALLGVPARVIVNSQRGAIIMTADIEIGPVAISQKDLTITTITPPPVATAQSPLVETQRWAALKTQARPSESAKLADLLNAFKQLNIPITERINVLQMLHKTGKLHAELIID